VEKYGKKKKKTPIGNTGSRLIDYMLYGNDCHGNETLVAVVINIIIIFVC
jgi:hypothetical protein